MNNTKKLDNEFYSCEEIGLNEQSKFVDPLLHKFMCWMTNADSFMNASEPDLNAKCLAICCDITTAVTSIYTPKHLGLAVHLFNEFGSRMMIEDLYNMGYTVSYDEHNSYLQINR